MGDPVTVVDVYKSDPLRAAPGLPESALQVGRPGEVVAMRTTGREAGIAKRFPPACFGAGRYSRYVPLSPTGGFHACQESGRIPRDAKTRWLKLRVGEDASGGPPILTQMLSRDRLMDPVMCQTVGRRTSTLGHACRADLAAI